MYSNVESKCLALCLITIIAARFLHLYACLTYSSVHASILHHCLPTITCVMLMSSPIACPPSSVLCWCLLRLFFLSVLKFSLVCFVLVTYGISCYYAMYTFYLRATFWIRKQKKKFEVHQPCNMFLTFYTLQISVTTYNLFRIHILFKDDFTILCNKYHVSVFVTDKSLF